MGLDKNRAWNLLNEISFERVAGTENERKAADILLNNCKSIGVDTVIESFEITDYEVYDASLEVLEPVYEKFHVVGISGSGLQNENRVEAGFKYIENNNETLLEDIKGKVVLSQGTLYASKLTELAEKGAVGYIVIDGSFYDDDQMKKEVRPSIARGESKMPGLRIHIEEAERLVRCKPEKVRLVLNSNKQKKSVSQNVVATIEGTEKPEEVIAFTAHYDSVPYSKGAWDNATGSVTIMELIHYFNEHKPKRTMKFIFCGAEELGCLGSKYYCELHKEELSKYIYNINYDMTGVTIGFELFCCTGSQKIIDGLKFFAKTEGYAVDCRLDNYSSDSRNFALNGIPACTFARIAPRGGAVIHNHNDIMNRLDADSLMITLEFSCKYAETIANAKVNPIPREFDDKIVKALDEFKKQTEYK